MDKTLSNPLTKRQQYWLEHVRACEASGLRVAEYTAQHDLTVRSMYAGKKMLVAKGILSGQRSGRFQRAQVIPTAHHNDWRIQLPNGVAVVFSGEVDAATLTTVLHSAALVE